MPSDDPKHPRPTKAGAKSQTVEDWLAQKLAALDPDDDEDEENIPTRAMRQVPQSGNTRVLKSPPPPKPAVPAAEPPPTASIVRPPPALVRTPQPPASGPPIDVVAAVPSVDEWPDFEPLTFPSDEIEPLDPPDAVLPGPRDEFAIPPLTPATPSAPEPAVRPAPSGREPPRAVASAQIPPVQPPPASPAEATQPEIPRAQRDLVEVSAGVVVATQEPGRRTPTVPPRRDPDDDDNMWDLFGDADARAPLAFGSRSGESELTHPGGWATPAPAPARATPVVTSAPAPPKPRGGNEEARFDALIAEVERKVPPPIRVAVQHGAEPRRRTGPFSRTPSSDDDTGTASTTEYADGFSDDTDEPEHIGTFDEVEFPGTASPPVPASPAAATVSVPVRRPPPQEDETGALLANTEVDRATHVAEDDHEPGTSWTVQPLGSLIADAETTRRSPSLEKNPLADEKTEIRSFKPIVPTTVEDVPTLIGNQRVVEADDSWSSPDDEPTGPMGATVSELSWNLITWLAVAIGMLLFTLLLGVLAIVVFSFLRV